MTLASDRIKTMTTLVEKLRAKYAKEIARVSTARDADDAANEAPVDGGSSAGASGGCFCHHDAVLRELVRSYLLWESTTAKADAAMRRIDDAVVDINELRVCLTDEVVSILGTGLSRVEERATRLRATLHDVFQREHCLRLSHLADRSRKDARQYLMSLAGVPEFVAARVALLRLGIHAMPVDERTLACLKHAKAVDPDADVIAAASHLDRAVKSGDGPLAHRAIQAWVDDTSAVVVRSGKAPATRKTAVPARTENKTARVKAGSAKAVRSEKTTARPSRAKKSPRRKSDAG
jgi:endonuclease III